ncbi:zinc transporter ZIP10-like [Amblyraja radiata]|uniref:zinc transporter ZIP10-like n=1 Tax=Amblyraja radiata TaxID=386614 RepID=UPI001404151F|nr:zinc transporter ZIP10-like [Amblyraja radiata]
MWSGILPLFLAGLQLLCTERVRYCQAQRLSVDKNDTLVQSAMREQRYYLLRLFGHYGDNGKLTFEGLHRLLVNLGLGAVQVVEIEHEDLGHAHVSHLDVLDLQEKGHVHSHVLDDHHADQPTSKVEANSATNPSTLSHRLEQRAKTKRGLPALGRDDDLWNRRPSGSKVGRLARQSVDETKSTLTLAKDITFNHSKFNHWHGNCLNVSQLLVNFGLSSVDEITMQQFAYICPALLHQIDSRVCIYHHDWLKKQQTNDHSTSVWLCGFAAITAISLTSLMAVAVIPFLGPSVSESLLNFLVALAVGTLAADALLHLMPHAQDHTHKTPESSTGHSLLEGKDAIWKGLTVLGGIYLLFLIENLIGLSRNHGRKIKSTDKRQQAAMTGLKMEDCVNVEAGRLDPDHEKMLKVSLSDCQRSEACDGEDLDETVTEVTSLGHSSHPRAGESEQGPRRDDSSLKPQGRSCTHSHALVGAQGSGMANIAWMVIVGDAVHNFTDGLAIGTAFSTGISGGLSTTIAVFCHELPHELGDFAVLIQAGMEVRRAVIFNLVSAVFSYLGMVLGIIVGQNTVNVTSWIFTITAGIFLYVALVDMLPEMLRSQSNGRRKRHLGQFLGENLGFLLGAGVMLCIALFEDRLLFDYSY